ncbi:MAG: HAMP domain-containing histidine kinase [Flavobacteriales bacterium]|nr:HAMP domain-containing histidine kinase [Flavobacteriales bacterium]
MNLNIKTRLTLQFTLIVSLILILFSVSVYYFSATYRVSEFYSRLENKAISTARLLVDVQEVDHDLLKIIDKNTNVSLYDEKVMIFDYKNKLIYNSSDENNLFVTEELLNQIRLENEVRLVYKNHEVLGLLYTDKFDRFVVIASALDIYGRNKLNNLKWVLILGFLLSIGIIVFLGKMFAARALKPMSEVVNQVEKITISSLNLRVDEGNGTDEISQLAITFNRMLEQLESAFGMQKSFVSNASHELRTPLTAITGQIEVTLMKARSQGEYKDILKSILDDIKNLNEISNGLLDLAKASSDISAITKQKVRIDELLWSARTELLNRKKEYKIAIQFITSIDDESLLTINGNEHLLKTAIFNLMDNACKYSADNSVSINLSVIDKLFTIEFIDNGIGIEPDELEKVFQPFYRAQNAKNISGSGLGLPLTKKIMEIHGGQLDIVSKINNGTTVKMIIPISN